MSGGETQTRAPLGQRWKAVLLTVVLNVLVFESISGFALFFLKPLVRDMTLLGQVHWIAGLLLALPYSIYQLRHYDRVRPHRVQLHYKVGLVTFFLMCAVIVTGILLIFEWRGLAYRIIDLSHIMAGFAILIMLVTHIVLVGKIAQTASSNPDGTAREIVWRLLAIPVSVWTLACLALLI